MKTVSIPEHHPTLLPFNTKKEEAAAAGQEPIPPKSVLSRPHPSYSVKSPVSYVPRTPILHACVSPPPSPSKDTIPYHNPRYPSVAEVKKNWPPPPPPPSKKEKEYLQTLTQLAKPLSQPLSQSASQ